jgi:hypothetical protein
MVQDRKGYILYPKTNLSIRLEEFMLRNLNLLLIMLIFIVMRLLALGIQFILKCLRKILLVLQMNIAFFKTFNAPFVLTNKSGKVVAKYVGGKHKNPKTCVWVPKVFVSNVKGPKPFGYLRTRPKFVLYVFASGGTSWIIESGCTNHMTWEKRMFSYEKNDDPQRALTLMDGNQGLVKGLGKIAISPDHSISNVFLVESLGYNLLSVSQLCKMGYNCLFTDVNVTAFRKNDDSLAFKGVLDGQLYLVDFTITMLN